MSCLQQTIAGYGGAEIAAQDICAHQLPTQGALHHFMSSKAGQIWVNRPA